MTTMGQTLPSPHIPSAKAPMTVRHVSTKQVSQSDFPHQGQKCHKIVGYLSDFPNLHFNSEFEFRCAFQQAR